MNAPRAWLIWTIGVFAYLVAVAQRTSFGVAGLEATERFHASAAAISFFTVLQLLVYAGLQIPVGVLVDRFGSRAMVAGGAVLMGLGQLQLAFADSVPGGVLGRVLVGAGDAMTFISVIRLVPLWFAPAKVPLVTQLTGMCGQLGQLFSVVPFALLLHCSRMDPRVPHAGRHVRSSQWSWFSQCFGTRHPDTRPGRQARASVPPESRCPAPGNNPAPGWGSGATSQCSSVGTFLR